MEENERELDEVVASTVLVKKVERVEEVGMLVVDEWVELGALEDGV